MKAAIIGCGVVSKFHVKTWRELGTEVVAVCDIYEPALKKLASSLKAKAYVDYKSMFENEEFDVVSIATPPFYHAEIIRAAVEKGCKVVVEKPFTVSSDEAAEFKENRDIAVIHNQVFQPFFYQALKALKFVVGRVYEVRVTTMASSEDPMTSNPEHWSHKLKGGRIAECLPHPIYIAQFFCRNDDLQVEMSCLLKRGISSANKIDELTAVLSASGVRAVLNVRLNALANVASVDVYGKHGMLKAAIIPRAASIHYYHNDRLKNRLMKQFFLLYKVKHSPRYLIFKSLMKGKPLVSASHAFHNIRILEELIG